MFALLQTGVVYLGCQIGRILFGRMILFFAIGRGIYSTKGTCVTGSVK